VKSFIELSAKGNRRLIVDTSAILGVMTAEGCDKMTVGTPTKPVTLILRNAFPVEVVGIEPVMVFAQIIAVQLKAEDRKDDGKALPIMVEWLDEDNEGEAASG